MKQLSKLTILICACAALALTARAGSEPLPSGKEMKEVAPAPPAGCSWTGLYLGLNGGYLWSDNNSVDTDSRDIFGNPGLNDGPLYGVDAAELATFSLSRSNDSFIGGGQIGFNWEFWRIVFGPEADIQGVPGSPDRTSEDSSITPVPGFPIVQTATVSKSLNYIGTVRGRLGFTVMPCLLVYGTGGFAYGEGSGRTGITQMVLNDSLLPNAYSGSGRFTDTGTGWTFGGGLEWMFLKHWSIKAEYLHYDLGSVSYNVRPLNNFNSSGTLFTTTAPTSNTKFDGNIVRAGLNIHF
jgi:outer membrane immunogenic protein